MNNVIPYENLHAAIRRISKEEAEREGVPLSAVLGMTRQRPAMLARRRAFQRLSVETGASDYAIAEAWGCGPNSVRYALKQPKRIFTPRPLNKQEPGFRTIPAQDDALAATLATFQAIDRIRGIS